MLKVTYTAYGRDFTRITDYNEEQIRFALEKICETVTNIIITPLRANSKLKKTCPRLEGDVNRLMDQEKALRDIFLIS